MVFLYIATETTPVDDWKNKIPSISGEHIRIGNNSVDVIGKTYNLSGFPGYIFFNSSHDLAASFTGFPGAETYVDLISSLAESR
ncbi:MAG: hypothetical protein J6C95_02985 [Muribaculaceae bacterium]|nr:hypothetical protein [Muribaculaceae bacterium]